MKIASSVVAVMVILAAAVATAPGVLAGKSPITSHAHQAHSFTFQPAVDKHPSKGKHHRALRSMGMAKQGPPNNGHHPQKPTAKSTVKATPKPTMKATPTPTTKAPTPYSNSDPMGPIPASWYWITSPPPGVPPPPYVTSNPALERRALGQPATPAPTKTSNYHATPTTKPKPTPTYKSTTTTAANAVAQKGKHSKGHH